MSGPVTLAGRREPRRPEPVLPMVNLVFLLLVFFLMAAIIAPDPPIRVRAPDAEAPPGLDLDSLRVAVGPDGRVYFGDAIGAAALEALGADLAAAPEPLAVAIHADGSAPAAVVAGLATDLARLTDGPVWLVTERRP